MSTLLGKNIHQCVITIRLCKSIPFMLALFRMKNQDESTINWNAPNESVKK
jgi:hypothetical protein